MIKGVLLGLGLEIHSHTRVLAACRYLELNAGGTASYSHQRSAGNNHAVLACNGLFKLACMHQ